MVAEAEAEARAIPHGIGHSGAAVEHGRTAVGHGGTAVGHNGSAAVEHGRTAVGHNGSPAVEHGGVAVGLGGMDVPEGFWDPVVVPRRDDPVVVPRRDEVLPASPAAAVAAGCAQGGAAPTSEARGSFGVHDLIELLDDD